MRSLSLILVAAATALGPLQAAPAPVTESFINDLASEALMNNPSLRAAEKRVLAARQNEASIRRWEDPEVRFGHMVAERSMRREDGDLIYEVEQKLPLFGKAAAARTVAEAETDVERADATLRAQIVRKDIAVAVYDAALARRIAVVTERDLVYLRTLAEVSEQRYANGTGSQVEVLRLQNEHSRKRQQLRSEQSLATNSIIRLARLVGRATAESLPHFDLPPVAPEIHPEKNLNNAALSNEPTLRKLRLEAARAESVAEETRLQRYPNISVGLEARQYSGSGAFREGGVFVALNVPWGNRRRYEADYERDKARKEAADEDARDYEFQIRADIHQIANRANTMRAEALAYENEVSPRTEMAMEATRAAWESNKGSLTDLLEARRSLLEADLTQARAIADQYKLLSELVLITGLPDATALQTLTPNNSSVPIRKENQAK